MTRPTGSASVGRRGFLGKLDFASEIAEPLKTMPAEILQLTGVACMRRSPEGRPIPSRGEDTRVLSRTTDDARKVMHAR